MTARPATRELPGEQQQAASPQAAEPEPLTGWATAYGDFVRCPACQRAYDTRHHKSCPRCGGGAGLAALTGRSGKQGGFPFGGMHGLAGLTMPGMRH